MNISFLKEKGSKYLIYILIGLLVLVFCMPTGTSNENTTKEEQSVQEERMEVQLEAILSAMEDVGKVKVMISVETEESSMFSQQNSVQKVCGVVVVAEGAGNPTVDAKIINAVKALFSIDAHKISIVKMRSQEGD